MEVACLLFWLPVVERLWVCQFFVGFRFIPIFRFRLFRRGHPWLLWVIEHVVSLVFFLVWLYNYWVPMLLLTFLYVLCLVPLLSFFLLCFTLIQYYITNIWSGFSLNSDKVNTKSTNYIYLNSHAKHAWEIFIFFYNFINSINKLIFYPYDTAPPHVVVSRCRSVP